MGCDPGFAAWIKEWVDRTSVATVARVMGVAESTVPKWMEQKKAPTQAQRRVVLGMAMNVNAVRQRKEKEASSI